MTNLNQPMQQRIGFVYSCCFSLAIEEIDDDYSMCIVICALVAAKPVQPHRFESHTNVQNIIG